MRHSICVDIKLFQALVALGTLDVPIVHLDIALRLLCSWDLLDAYSVGVRNLSAEPVLRHLKNIVSGMDAGGKSGLPAHPATAVTDILIISLRRELGTRPVTPQLR